MTDVRFSRKAFLAGAAGLAAGGVATGGRDAAAYTALPADVFAQGIELLHELNHEALSPNGSSAARDQRDALRTRIFSDWWLKAVG